MLRICNFPNSNIDVALCSKNGNTTIRRAYASCYYTFEYQEQNSDFIREFLKDENFYSGFRKNAIKYAIKRDPVDRFISTVNHFKQRYNAPWIQGEASKLLSPDCTPTDALSILTKKWLKPFKRKDLSYNYPNSVWLSQTHQLGNIKDYDIVFDITEMYKFMKIINDSCKPKENLLNFKRIKPIEKIAKDFYKFTKKDFTNEQIEFIIFCYKEDYENGWY